MAITNGYATLAEFKLWVTVRGGAVGTDTNDDAVMEDIIELVSRYLDGETGRRFYKNSVDETRYFQTDGADVCYVDDLSATPTTVSVDYGGLRSYTDLDATDFECDPANASLDGMPYTSLAIMPESSAYFPEGKRGVKVVGKFGFPSVPEDIKNLTLATAQNIWQGRTGQSSQGNISVTASGIVIRPQDVPDWGSQIIRKYRKFL